MIRKNNLDTGSALVLFSGGQDSTVCLFWALQKFTRIEAVCFSYGQRHSSEIGAAKAIAQKTGIAFRTVDLSVLSGLSANSLTDASIEMDREQSGNLPPNSFVPGRNLLFISVAAIIAREKGIANLVTGVSQADYSGYPDCRDDFIRSLNNTVNLAMDEQFVIHTPLMMLDKAQIWRLAEKLGVFDTVMNETVTCYNGIPAMGCGSCPACKLRQRGLQKYQSIPNS